MYRIRLEFRTQGSQNPHTTTDIQNQNILLLLLFLSVLFHTINGDSADLYVISSLDQLDFSMAASCSTSNSSSVDLLDRCNLIPLSLCGSRHLRCSSSPSSSSLRNLILSRRPTASFANLRLRLLLDGSAAHRANYRIRVGTRNQRFITAVARADPDRLDDSHIKEVSNVISYWKRKMLQISELWLVFYSCLVGSLYLSWKTKFFNPASPLSREKRKQRETAKHIG